MDKVVSQYFPIVIVEVLILQRFPYGKDSTFFYFATGETAHVKTGDIVKVPWRRGEKNGVVAKTKEVTVNSLPDAQWKINIKKLIKNKDYFFADIPDKPINLKPVSLILEKEYFSSELLSRLRASAKEYFVSWNHFAKSVTDFIGFKMIRRISPKNSYLTLISKWFKENGYDRSVKKTIARKATEIHYRLKNFKVSSKNSFVFASYEQEKPLSEIIKKTIREGKQVLVLVPEKIQLIPIVVKYIELTKTFAFGTPMLLGKFLPRMLFRSAWQMTRQDSPHIFIGTRSSIFAPFSSLGLIIIEEGHDSSHKQWDLSPLYDVRKLASLLYPETLKIYLSVTPRLQDFFDSPHYLTSKRKELKVSTLDPNLIGRQKPNNQFISIGEEAPHTLTRLIQFGGVGRKVILVNMNTENKLVGKAIPISRILKKHVITALQKGKSVLLLANHKGIANLVMCQDCGYVPRCPKCGKALSYEKSKDLNCRLCGFHQQSLQKCPRCSGFKFVYKNFGIETIKDSLESVRKKVNFSLIIPPEPSASNSKWWEFSEKLINKNKKPAIYLGYAGLIPIGKSLQKNISLAGFLSFDELLFNPDYSSFEKAASRFYNLLSFSKKVYVQTSDPLQPFLQKIIHNPYSLLFSEWLEERRNFSYPPYSKMYIIDVPNSKFSDANNVANRITKQLDAEKEVIEAIAMPIASYSKRNKYGASVLVKTKTGGVKDNLIIDSLFKKFGNLRIDPDPYA